ncbi:hypothetical protein PUN28_017345 [Cardiocondyla obscurior]|uniref:Uncharacterized protein n=1 Tax=Cardiocondyla obscurior TaxID=286306 RepID=A0AAW2EQD1_9HYME
MCTSFTSIRASTGASNRKSGKCTAATAPQFDGIIAGETRAAFLRLNTAATRNAIQTQKPWGGGGREERKKKRESFRRKGGAMKSALLTAALRDRAITAVGK